MAKSLWVACLLMAFSIKASEVMAEDLKVMSFNIRFGTAGDGKDAWPLRRDLVLKTIADYQPDLLGTQETLPFQAEFLKAGLKDYDYVGWSRDASENGEQCGIFLRRDRFEVIESGQFWLSETPDIRNSKSWDSSLPRVATWIRLKDRKTENQELLFANTHFDHRGTEARKMSARLLKTRLNGMAPSMPVIVTGDFNCDEGTEPWNALLTDSWLVDSLRTVQPVKGGNEGTFHGFTGTPGDARIDWILSTSHFRAAAAAIDRSHQDGRYPSDHFPVTATFHPLDTE